MEYSLTDLARLTGLSRRKLEYRAKKGGIPMTPIHPGLGAKLVVSEEVLRERCPDLWEQIEGRRRRGK